VRCLYRPTCFLAAWYTASAVIPYSWYSSLNGADAPNLDRHTRINAETRREVFLIFKEGINNVARHSACRRADAALRIDRGMIIFTLKDDGRGFKTANGSIGHGLESMRSRAEKLGGRLEVLSKPGQGTAITLRAPLGRHP